MNGSEPRKRTAVLIYPGFCNFEIAPALEMLALAGKPITVFARRKALVKSEEGLSVMPDKSIEELDIAQFDSLLLPGAEDIREAVEDEAVLDFVRKFDGMPIGAISVGPVLLLKAGMLAGKPFMAGVDARGLAEEGFTREELALLHDWPANLRDPIPAGFLRSGNIVTAMCSGFLPWAMEFGEMLGIETNRKTFGL